MQKNSELIKSKRRRRRAFDRAEALKKAMLLFWSRGYEDTSLEDLTRALDVTPPSIYQAFGNKKTLFFKAVDLYLAVDFTASQIIEVAGTAREAAIGLLNTSAHAFTRKGMPSGCLIGTATFGCGPDVDDVRQYLAKIRVGIETKLARKISRDISIGVLPVDTNPTILASYIVGVTQGMSTLARDGASRTKLLRIAEIALKSWPT